MNTDPKEMIPFVPTCEYVIIFAKLIHFTHIYYGTVVQFSKGEWAG